MIYGFPLYAKTDSSNALANSFDWQRQGIFLIQIGVNFEFCKGRNLMLTRLIHKGISIMWMGWRNSLFSDSFERPLWCRCGGGVVCYCCRWWCIPAMLRLRLSVWWVSPSCLPPCPQPKTWGEVRTGGHCRAAMGERGGQSTVEPLNKGHFETSYIDSCWEVVLFSEV